MGKEREIKLRIADLAAIRRSLRKIGARIRRARLREHNVLFDTPQRSLAKGEQLLRIRTERGSQRGKSDRERSVVTFKNPVAGPRSGRRAERHKVREEIEVEISDPRRLATILEALGMRPWFAYEKFRTTFCLPASRAWAKGLLLELDETPIGIFLELEGRANAIDRAAKALGFQSRDYVLGNYLTLYREFCRNRGTEPGDMLFTKNRKTKRAR